MMFLLCLLWRPGAQKRGHAGAFGDALEARDEAPRQNGLADTSCENSYYEKRFRDSTRRASRTTQFDIARAPGAPDGKDRPSRELASSAFCHGR